MNKGRAAKDLATALITAADDEDEVVKQWFKVAEISYAKFTGDCFNRTFRALTGRPCGETRRLVAAATADRPDQQEVLEWLHAQLCRPVSFVAFVESPVEID